jgi:DNA polymerase-3 subunit alpha
MHLLSAKTDFSIGESLIQVKRLAERAEELGYESVAIADTMTISSMVDFSNKLNEKGIKPIIGVTLRVVDDPLYREPKKGDTHESKQNPSFTVKVYAKNDLGMKSILRVLSKANSVEYFYYVSRVGMEELLSMEGVVVTTGDMFGLFTHPRWEEVFDKLHAKFLDDFLTEIVPIQTPLFDLMNKNAISVAKKHDVKMIASYPAYYDDATKASSLDAYRAIVTRNTMSSPTLPVPFSRDYVLSAPKFLFDKVIDMIKRIDSSASVSKLATSITGNQSYLNDNCEYNFTKKEPCLPVMAPDEFKALAIQSQLGWNKRFGKKVLGHQPTEDELPIYRKRLVYELSVLKKMNFSAYFLLTQDIVNWSKESGIIVGPGRGSVGGSLVAYLMGITDVDPIRFNLLFERFINPSRLDLPDADLDFQSSRRHEVLEYIVEKYGRDRVAGVSNYSTMASASALRDTGRVYEVDNFSLSCTKLVPKEHGSSVTLTEASKAVPEIEKFMLENDTVWQTALHLEGAMRNLGRHAAGVVVAGEPLIERAVVETRQGEHVVNWDKRVVEDWGLIKLDILGLSTLDVLELAGKYIKERHGKTINYLNIPLEESDVMKAFGEGNTTAIFQFESGGMKKLLKDLASVEPLTFNELSAATALYRPGPMDSGMLDEYVAIRKGIREPFYEHELMREALEETGGVIVYQEQVMRVAGDLAGFTMTEADNLRKAMGKKDKEKMSTMREQWVEGCAKEGMNEEHGGILFDKIEMFAGYGFNKSHSVEYSIISYWAMWLKVRYPAEFYAASMTVADDDDKLSALVIDAKSRGLRVLPPCVNRSTGRIEIYGEKELFAPFQAIKGISENVAKYITDYRDGIADKKFTSVEDFTPKNIKATLGHAKLNKKHVDNLTRVGALACVDPTGLPAKHLDRVRDQVELMPGFSVDAVKADRDISTDKLGQLKIIRMMDEMTTCDKCSLKGGVHVYPRMGKTAKFMVVFDSPDFAEERSAQFLTGDRSDILKAAIKEVGLSPNDGYYTSLVKVQKNGKVLANEQINGCSEYLMKEIEILKPAVILTAGSAATRFFAPGVKGGNDLAGKVIYRADLDASVVFGINPIQCKFDTTKVKHVLSSLEKVAEIIS